MISFITCLKIQHDNKWTKRAAALSPGAHVCKSMILHG